MTSYDNWNSVGGGRVFALDIIRIIAAISVIILHSFAIYTGSWHEPIAFEYIRLYDIIGHLFSTFAVPSFVAIAGFLFQKSKNSNFHSFIYKKIKRLILPSLVFSYLYVIVFKHFDGWNSVMEIVNGAGHLWFLPMLFWCYILAFILKYVLNLKLKWVLLISILLLGLQIFDIPLGVSRCFAYFIYFVLGALICEYEKLTHQNKHNVCVIVSLLIIYIISFSFSIYIDDLPKSTFVSLCGKIGKYVNGITSTLIIFMLAEWLVPRVINKKVLLEISSCSMGVYILQQFVLMILLYKIQLSRLISPLLLPWTMFIVTLTLCYIFTGIALKTKIGRDLLA